MYENLLKTVTNLGSPKVLVVGDFMLDVYVFGDALRISPDLFGLLANISQAGIRVVMVIVIDS